MKKPLHKSAIPDNRTFIVRELADPYFDPLWHAHSEYQLFLVLEGTGTRFIGDSIRSFKPGELVFMGPHIPHLWRSDEAYFQKNSGLRTHGIVLYLREDFLEKEIQSKEEFHGLKKLFNRSSYGLEFQGKKKEEVIELLRGMTGKTGIDSIISLLQILQHLSSTHQYKYICHKAYEVPYEKIEADRMNTIYYHVMNHYSRPISLKELADLVHMTPASFSRYFTMRNNKTVSDFLKEIRIAQACKLLAETDQMVADISYHCGFNTLSNFNVQFRALMGCRPSEYRRTMMQL